METELLWNIRIAIPEAETRRLHRLLRRRKANTLTTDERQELQALLDTREQRGAQRMETLMQLARLRNIPVRQLMEQLNIRPIPFQDR